MSSTVDYSFDRLISTEALKALFQQTSWAKHRNDKDIAELLANSPIRLGVWQENRLVGYARALTDGRFRALIDDVVVDESCRGSGIGSEIITRLVTRLAAVEEVFLLADESMVAYYERRGFKRTMANCLTWPK